jgi:hypothetical protein
LARKKKTANQQAYQKERKRLLQAINRAEKKGYVFDENLVPNVPKRVTQKALERIRQTKPNQLYSKAVYLDQDTGEVIPALERKKEVRRQASKRAYEKRKKEKAFYPTIDIIERIRTAVENLERYTYPFIPIEGRKNEVLSILDDTVMFSEMNNTLDQYIEYLKKNENEIFMLAQDIEYMASSSDAVFSSFVALARILNWGSLSPMQAQRVSEMSEVTDYE